MMWIAATALLGLLLGVLMILVFRREVRKQQDRVWALTAALLPVLLSIFALVVAAANVREASGDWANSRLTPLFAPVYGYQMYPPIGEGPILTAFYGPVAYFAFVASLLGNHPSTALLIASASATLWYLVPVALTIFLLGSKSLGGVSWKLLLVLLFGYVTLGNESLRLCATMVHADAPALGFGVLACLFAIRQRAYDRSSADLALCAAAMTCSILTKQTMAWLLLAIPLYLYLADGLARVRKHLVFLLSMGLFAVLLSVVFGAPRNMVANMLQLPSRHPIGSITGMQRYQSPESLASAILSVGKTFYLVTADFFQLGLWVFAFVAVLIIVYPLVTGRTWRNWRERMRSESASLFLLSAIVSLPLAFLGYAKIGGDVNHLGIPYYFAAVGGILLLDSIVGSLRNEYPQWQNRIVGSVLASVVLATAAHGLPLHPDYFNGRVLFRSRTAQAYEYAREHPGEVYFPWHPLASLLAEKKLYHFEYGIYDREIAGQQVTVEHFRQHLPAKMQYVTLPASVATRRSPVLEYLPEFCRELRIPELHGFVLYERSADCVAASVPGDLDFSHRRSAPRQIH